MRAKLAGLTQQCYRCAVCSNSLQDVLDVCRSRTWYWMWMVWLELQWLIFCACVAASPGQRNWFSLTILTRVLHDSFIWSGHLCLYTRSAVLQ